MPFFSLLITCGGALTVFQITSWTSLFLELGKKRGVSKLVRLVRGAIQSIKYDAKKLSTIGWFLFLIMVAALSFLIINDKTIGSCS